MGITFINEMADLCERTGANVQDVTRDIGLDNRNDSMFLNAGPGCGGSCFLKDTFALVRTRQDYGAPLRLVEDTVEVKDRRKRAMGRKVITAMCGNVRGKTVGILGRTFKPNTDSMRDALSITVIQAQDAGSRIQPFAPEGLEMAKQVRDGINYADDAYGAAAGADGLVLVTEWNALRSLRLISSGLNWQW